MIRGTRLLRQLALFPARLLVGVLVVLSEIFRPAYGRLVAWMSALSFIERFSAFIATLPRGAILVMFAIPFAVAEPLKVYAVVLIGQGHFVPGIAIIVVAYLLSFVVVERIYDAGKVKLLTFTWFKWIMDCVGTVQEWIKSLKEDVVSRVRKLWGHWRN